MDFEVWLLIVFTLLLVCPFLIYPLSLMLFNKTPLKLIKGKKIPHVAILFCCYNEESSISAKLANLSELMAKYHNLSVYVYLDACTDKTAHIIKSARLGINILEGKQRSGKNAGLNKLMKLAPSMVDIVVFNDANVILDVDSFGKIADYFSDPKVGCVNPRQFYINEDESPTAKAGGLYWRFEEWLKKTESEVGSTVAVDGSLFAIRKSLFRELPGDVPNDMFTSLDILSRNYRVISAPDVYCYEKSAVRSKDEFFRKIRIACRAMTCHLAQRGLVSKASFQTRYFYLCHKLLRWFSAYWLVGTVFSGVWVAFDFGYGSEVVAFIIIAAVVFLSSLYVRIPLLSMVSDMILAFLATSIGVSMALVGVRKAIWSVPQSSRG